MHLRAAVCRGHRQWEHRDLHRSHERRGHMETVTGLDGGSSIDGVSCVSGTLCLGVDEHGSLLSSTDPTGDAGAWTVASIDGAHALHAVSCVSMSLCFADDGQGDVLSSTNPTAGAGAWSVNDVAEGASLGELSCVPGLCVVEDEGGILASSDPTGGAGAWVKADGVEHGRLSCASAALCVAIPSGTNVGPWTSTDPTGGSAAWVQEAGPEDGAFLGSVSCASTSLCVIGDRTGNIAISTEAHILSVSLSGAGLGTVKSTPIQCPFVNCSHAVPGIIQPLPLVQVACADTFGLATGPWGTCSLGYPAGNAVTSTATPSSGSVFGGWSGACGAGSSCAVSMSSDRSISAAFTQATTFTPSDTSPLTSPRLTGVHNRRSGGARGTRSRQAPARGSSRSARPSPSTSTPASVAFTFSKSVSGRRVGRTCFAQTKKNEKKPCTRGIAAATLRFSASAGRNKVSFAGSTVQHKKLAPGAYTLTITATASGRHSPPSTLRSPSPAAAGDGEKTCGAWCAAPCIAAAVSRLT